MCLDINRLRQCSLRHSWFVYGIVPVVKGKLHDRTIDNPDKHNYNLINAQLNIRF